MSDQSIPTRAAEGLLSGFLAGSFMGAVTANWSTLPVVLKDKPWPALARTGAVMGRYGATFGAVGLTFATVDAVSENVRGKVDWVNGALAGLATGGVLGLRLGSFPIAVGAALALAATSASVDVSGRTLRNHGFIDDGETAARNPYPYSSATPKQE